MSLLSDGDRLPHLFGLRAERPVHRYGVVALAVPVAVLLIAVNAVTARLIPLYAIGVFTGFTISQTGLVRHWHSRRTPRWLLHAALNGADAILTATAVFVVTKFTAGAWIVVLTVSALMLLFSGRPEAARSAAFCAGWDRRNPGVRLDTLDSPYRSLARPVTGYARHGGRQTAVPVPGTQPRPVASPHPAEPARTAPAARPARQHLHHPGQAQHSIASDLCNVTLLVASICQPQSLSNACSMTSVSAGWM